MTNLLYVCLDGLGDDPIPEFDGRTPLEAAPTPNLDALAQRGRTGTVVTVGPGIAPESDIGVFGILGYDPKEEHPGRGVLEALGIGMDFGDGDLAYRINFATAEWHDDRRPARGPRSQQRRGARARGRGERPTHARRAPRSTCGPPSSTEVRSSSAPTTARPLSANVTNTDPAYRREGHLGVALETFEPVVVDLRAAGRHRRPPPGRRS